VNVRERAYQRGTEQVHMCMFSRVLWPTLRSFFFFSSRYSSQLSRPSLVTLFSNPTLLQPDSCAGGRACRVGQLSVENTGCEEKKRCAARTSSRMKHTHTHTHTHGHIDTHLQEPGAPISKRSPLSETALPYMSPDRPSMSSSTTSSNHAASTLRYTETRP
jgi:hypothetical protein